MRSKKRVTIIGILFLFLVSFLLLWRHIPQSPSDNSILSQQPCRVPCWHNLVPQETTLEVARNSLMHDDFVDNLSEINPAFQPERVDLFWGNGNRIIFFNNILALVMIKPNIDFSLQDILDVYGQPSGTRINSLPTSSRDKTVTMSLFYPEDGLMIDFEVFKGDMSTKEKFDLENSLLGISFTLAKSTTSLKEFVPSTVGATGILSPDYMEKFITLGLPDLTNSVVIFSRSSSSEVAPQIVTITPSS